MLLEKEVQRLFQELIENEFTHLFLDGSDVNIRIFDNSSKLSLITPVYFGGNYIPKRVREAITKTPPFEKDQVIKAFLTVDEENFRIFLHYLGTTEVLNSAKFTHLLEDFCHLANEWRIYLDEHDRQDRVYIYSK